MPNFTKLSSQKASPYKVKNPDIPKYIFDFVRICCHPKLRQNKQIWALKKDTYIILWKHGV